MTPEDFNQWALTFSLAAAIAALSLGIIVFYSLINDKKAGISIIVAFAIAGIGKAAQYYVLSAVAVVLMIPMVGFYSFKQRKKPVIWINWLCFFIAAPLAFYAYRMMYLH